MFGKIQIQIDAEFCHLFFEDGMGYERYVDYALDVPMYFVYRGKYLDVSDSLFGIL